MPNCEKHYTEVLRDYTSYIFSNTGSLALLDNEGTGDAVKLNIPSWTSDFQPIIIIPIDYRPAHRQDCLEISLESRKLTVDGVLLGQIIVSRPGMSRINDGPEEHSELRLFYDNFLTESGRLRGVGLDTCWENYMHAVFRFSGAKPTFRTFEEAIETLKDDDNEEYPFAWFLLQAFDEWGHVLLDNGEILFYRPKKRNLAEGDHVAVAFKGSIAYTILEVTGDGEYRCVAQAQLMKDMAFPPEPHDLGAEFFVDNALDRFTII
jgi:hypothetical protein